MKVDIIKDFYETSNQIKKLFGDSLTDAILLNDWKPKKQKRGVIAMVRKSPFHIIAAGDEVNKIWFNYNVPDGLNVKGEFLYRVRRHGIDIISGASIFIEEEEH